MRECFVISHLYISYLSLVPSSPNSCLEQAALVKHLVSLKREDFDGQEGQRGES